ncbi:excalibur calcium-binding domain-containing protein [Marmoricola sp. RAF53]|uniref:excalibur calcium-binding domain-containing protein n=1 Tax=Marmoricola sp. RAF53 TaxID=3233059 RepID=UPI003F973545
MADPGWYPQPDGSQRYWDGQVWTEHVQQPTPVPASATKTGATWWKSKPAIGVGAGLFGLILGVGMGGSDTGDADALNTRISTLSEQKADLKQEVASLEDDVAAKDNASQAAVDDQVAGAVAEANAAAKAAQQRAVAAAVAKERKKADQRVAAAREEAAANQPRPLTGGGGGGGGTDPHFGTCGEANDNGYGPYTEGVDPEYDWYQDRDGDGVVCES